MSKCVFADFNIKTLVSMHQLEFLEIGYAKNYHDFSFSGLENLKWISLHHIDESLCTLSLRNVSENLIVLKINYSEFNITPEKLISTFKDFKHTKLKVLDLSFNYFERFEASWISGLSSLKKLFLANTWLSYVDLNSEFLSGLETLSLHYVNESQQDLFIDKLLCLRSLNLKTKVKLSNNFFKHLANLQCLTYYCGFIWSIEKDFFNGLLNLTVLDLNCNSIRSIDSEAFRHTPQLEKLDLAGNMIDLKPDMFIHLTKLTFLSLDANQINTLGKRSFLGLKNLEILTLKDNKIKHLTDSNEFEGLIRLRKLNLQNNQLTNLDLNVFSTLSLLEELDLFGNPWFLKLENSENVKYNIYGWYNQK